MELVLQRQNKGKVFDGRKMNSQGQGRAENKGVVEVEVCLRMRCEFDGISISEGKAEDI